MELRFNRIKEELLGCQGTEFLRKRHEGTYVHQSTSQYISCSQSDPVPAKPDQAKRCYLNLSFPIRAIRVIRGLSMKNCHKKHKRRKIHLVASVPLFTCDHVAFTGSVVAKNTNNLKSLFAKRSCSGEAGSSDQRKRC